MSETQLRIIKSFSCPQTEKELCINGVSIGRPDDITDIHVIERKEISKWKHAVGLVLVYAMASGKKPKLELVSDDDLSNRLLPAILLVCEKYGISYDVIDKNSIKKKVTELGLDKETNWRMNLTRDILREYMKSDVSKDQLVILANDKLLLSDLKKNHLEILAKKKGINSSGKKKEVLLQDVMKAWPNTTLETVSTILHLKNSYVTPQVKLMTNNEMYEMLKKQGSLVSTITSGEIDYSTLYREELLNLLLCSTKESRELMLANRDESKASTRDKLVYGSIKEMHTKLKAKGLVRHSYLTCSDDCLLAIDNPTLEFLDAYVAKKKGK